MDFVDKTTVFVFPGQEDTPEDERAKVAIRPCNFSKVQEIIKRHTIKKVEFHKDRKRDPLQRFEVEESNDDAMFEDSWDYSITEWENVHYGDEKNLACTRENKLMLLRKSVFFLTCATNWRDAMEAEYEESRAEGN